MIPDVTGVILAGGKSSRFGANKAFAPFRGTPIIRRVIESLRPLFSDLLLVTNTPADYAGLGVPVIQDIVPDRGPLGGIVTAFRNTVNDRIFVVGCDMPVLEAGPILRILAEGKDADAAIPVHGGIREYLMALYSRSLLPRLACCLSEERLSLRDFFDRLTGIAWVPVEGDFWFNVNTKKDLESLEERHAD